MSRSRLLCVILTTLFALACDPIVMIPGGALSGTERPVPDSWAFTDDVDTVQLETRPSDPYSVNIWCVAIESALYVGGARESAWTQHVVADPNVRLRVGEDLYALRATEATSDAEAEAFMKAAFAKYETEIDPELRAEAILFRLEPRV